MIPLSIILAVWKHVSQKNPEISQETTWHSNWIDDRQIENGNLCVNLFFQELLETTAHEVPARPLEKYFVAGKITA